MKKKLETLAVQSLIPVLRAIPLSVARLVGTGFGKVFCKLLGLRREVVEKNLRRAFPDWSDEDVRETASETYRFFTRAAIDWLRYEDVREAESIEVTGWEHARPLEEDGGIIVTGHIGYWELAASELANRFDSFTVYADRQSNPGTDRIIRNLREDRGVYSVDGPNGLRKLVRRVEDGRVVGVIGDQRPRNQHEYVKFFGDQVKNTRILSFVARKTGRPVVPVAMVRTGPESIQLRVFPPLECSRKEVSDDNRCNLLREYNAWLEERIREFPKQYFWPHRRWKGSRDP